MKKRRSIQALKHALYSRKNYFTYFKDITKEKHKELLEKAKAFKEKVEIERILPELHLYMDTLAYITEPPHSFDLTYDEKLVFLIEVIDPDLITYKVHKETETISPLDLAKAKDANEKSLIIIKKAQEAKIIEDTVRSKLKFYDRNLALYEKYYSSLIKNRKNFEETPKKDLTPLIFANSSNITFDSITNERFEEINKIAQNWIATTNSEGDNKRAAFNLIYQENLLGLTNTIEKIIFFILTVDPNLKALTIYSENGKWEQIKEEMILALGFYSKELIKSEEKYHKRFVPQKSISEFLELKSN